MCIREKIIIQNFHDLCFTLPNDAVQCDCSISKRFIIVLNSLSFQNTLNNI